MSPGEYYRFSNAVPLDAIPKLAGAALGSVGAGFAYGYVAYYQPLHVMNGFLACGLGIAVAGLLSRAAVAGKIRSPIVLAGLGLALGLIADYAGWITHILAATHHKELVWQPERILHVIFPLGHGGYSRSFTMIPFGWRMNLDPNMNALIAVVEAGLVMGFAAHGAATLNRDLFCETCDRWGFSTRTIDPEFAPIADPRAFRRELERGETTMLQGLLGSANYRGERWSELTVEFCSGCLSVRLLTVKAVRSLLGRRDVVPVVRRIQVDGPTFTKLEAFFRRSDSTPDS